MDSKVADFLVSISRFLPRNKKGEIIVELPAGRKFYMNENRWMYVFYDDSMEKKPIAEVDEDELYAIASYLDSNKQVLQSLDALITYKHPEEFNWEVLPEPIQVENETIGMVGIAKIESNNGKDLLSVLYFSADGTYATLTMFGADSDEEKATAKLDLAGIIGVLNKITNQIK